jgi:hypothetical protein
VSFGLKCSFLSGAKANKATWSEELAAANDDPNKATLKSEQMYRQCRNKLHVVTTTLLNSDLVAQIQAWYCISVPLRNLTAEAGTVAELCSAVVNLNFTVTYKYTQDGNRPAIKPQVGNSAQCEIAGLWQRGMQLAGSCRALKVLTEIWQSQLLPETLSSAGLWSEGSSVVLSGRTWMTLK